MRKRKEPFCKKAGVRLRDCAELKETVEAFTKDIEKVREYIKIVERELAENLSGYVGSTGIWAGFGKL